MSDLDINDRWYYTQESPHGAYIVDCEGYSLFSMKAPDINEDMPRMIHMVVNAPQLLHIAELVAEWGRECDERETPEFVKLAREAICRVGG